MHRHLHVARTLALELAHQSPAIGHDQRFMALADQFAGELHRATLDPAAIEIGQYLQDPHRTALGNTLGKRATSQRAARSASHNPGR